MNDDINTARDCAQRLLARREHSRLELERKLQLRDFSLEYIEQVLTELADNNLQCDQRFTEAYIRSRGQRGYGPTRIQKELQDRGVTSELIARHLDGGDAKWLERACDVRDKKFGSDLPSDFELIAKQMKFLEYRGFTMEQIKKAVKA